MGWSYYQLKEEMPQIAEIVRHFPESLQEKVFDLMIGQLLDETYPGSQKPAVSGAEELEAKSDAGQAKAEEVEGKGRPRSNRIYGIARLTEEGRIELTLKDPRGRSKNDTARRLAYLALRAHELLTGQEWASFRRLVVPILKQWDVLSNNTRQALAHDRCIIRLDEDRDQVSLNAAGRMRADTYMEEIRGRKTGFTRASERFKEKVSAEEMPGEAAS